MALNFDSSLDEIEKIIPSPKINTKNIKDLFSECEESKSNIDSKINNIDSFGDISQINNVEENSSLLNNNKNSKLPSTSENTENSKKIKYNEEYNFKNIKSNRINNNNDTKYKILFDENKKMNLNSLREEYNKIKNDNNHNNYNKRYINIFNDNKQKINSNLLLKIGNNKRKLN